MDIDLNITWPVPFRWGHHEREEIDRINAAICEFADSPATFDWFQARGYTLFKRSGPSKRYPGDESFYPRILSGCSTVRAEYPFPHHNLSRLITEEEDRIWASFGKIWFAQDGQGRHVVMTLVKEGSDELRIYEFIRQQTFETLQRVCLLPVLDILPLTGYRFVVMPRWGSNIMSPALGTLGEVTDILHAMLKALAFLHSHNIIHRDIDSKNMLVNHYCPGGWDESRKKLRSSGQLSYALIDFDISMVFPPGAPRSACRLPSKYSYDGTWPQPDEPTEEQPDYDPFAFDVGTLGMRFCGLIQIHTADLPFLAPFLDRMTCRDASRRFTAEEALQFFTTHLKEVAPEALAKPFDSDAMNTTYFDMYDRWSVIPEELAEKWAEYREPLNLSRRVWEEDSEDIQDA